MNTNIKKHKIDLTTLLSLPSRSIYAVINESTNNAVVYYSTDIVKSIFDVNREIQQNLFYKELLVDKNNTVFYWLDEWDFAGEEHLKVKHYEKVMIKQGFNLVRLARTKWKVKIKRLVKGSAKAWIVACCGMKEVRLGCFMSGEVAAKEWIDKNYENPNCITEFKFVDNFESNTTLNPYKKICVNAKRKNFTLKEQIDRFVRRGNKNVRISNGQI